MARMPRDAALLVARNAIRGKLGVSFINVTQGGWDTHVGQFDRSLAHEHVPARPTISTAAWDRWWRI